MLCSFRHSVAQCDGVIWCCLYVHLFLCILHLNMFACSACHVSCWVCCVWSLSGLCCDCSLFVLSSFEILQWTIVCVVTCKFDAQVMHMCSLLCTWFYPCTWLCIFTTFNDWWCVRALWHVECLWTPLAMGHACVVQFLGWCGMGWWSYDCLMVSFWHVHPYQKGYCALCMHVQERAQSCHM